VAWNSIKPYWQLKTRASGSAMNFVASHPAQALSATLSLCTMQTIPVLKMNTKPAQKMSVSCAEPPYELVHSHYMIRITQENS
jgi:hypothetical protein